MQGNFTGCAHPWWSGAHPTAVHNKHPHVPPHDGARSRNKDVWMYLEHPLSTAMLYSDDFSCTVPHVMWCVCIPHIQALLPLFSGGLVVNLVCGLGCQGNDIFTNAKRVVFAWNGKAGTGVIWFAYSWYGFNIPLPCTRDPVSLHTDEQRHGRSHMVHMLDEQVFKHAVVPLTISRLCLLIWQKLRIVRMPTKNSFCLNVVIPSYSFLSCDQYPGSDCFNGFFVMFLKTTIRWTRLEGECCAEFDPDWLETVTDLVPKGVIHVCTVSFRLLLFNTQHLWLNVHTFLMTFQMIFRSSWRANMTADISIILMLQTPTNFGLMTTDPWKEVKWYVCIILGRAFWLCCMFENTLNIKHSPKALHSVIMSTYWFLFLWQLTLERSIDLPTSLHVNFCTLAVLGYQLWLIGWKSAGKQVIILCNQGGSLQTKPGANFGFPSRSVDVQYTGDHHGIVAFSIVVYWHLDINTDLRLLTCNSLQLFEFCFPIQM